MSIHPNVFGKSNMLGFSVFLIFCFLIILPVDTEAQTTQGPNGPKTAIDPVTGCLACPGGMWTASNNVLKKDSLYASTQLNASPACFQSSCYYARSLITRNFGFSIPTAATINGITVGVWRRAGTASAIADSVVQLMKNNIPAGTNNASRQAWPVVNAMATYGGPAVLWGTTWLPAEVNDSGFGLLLRPINRGNLSAQASIDYVQISVYYTNPTGIVPEVVPPLNANTIQCTSDSRGIHISFTVSKSAELYHIAIVNAAGKMISGKTITCVHPAGEFSIPGLANGLYFVRVGWPGGDFSKKELINK